MSRKRKTFQIADAFHNVFQSAWVPAFSEISVELTYRESNVGGDTSSTRTVTVISDKDLWAFINKHWDWSYFETGIENNTAMECFWDTWNTWRNMYREEIQRMANAWFNPYDPLNNYNKFEHNKTTREYDSLITEHIHGDETTTRGDVEVTDGGGTETMNFDKISKTMTPASYTHVTFSDTENGEKLTINNSGDTFTASFSGGDQVQDTTAVSTYNTDEKETQNVTHGGDVAQKTLERMIYEDDQVNDETQARKDEKTIGERTVTTKQVAPDVVTRGKDTDVTDGSYDDITRNVVFGNIGVTTSQQMLDAELQLRATGLKTRLLDMFLNEWFWLSPLGGECDAY